VCSPKVTRQGTEEEGRREVKDKEGSFDWGIQALLFPL